jgi:hypothetical protein
MAEPKSDSDAIEWSLTTWEGAMRQKLKRWAALSLEDILRAQEEMAELAARLGNRRDPEGASSSGAARQIAAVHGKIDQSRN